MVAQSLSILVNHSTHPQRSSKKPQTGLRGRRTSPYISRSKQKLRFRNKWDATENGKAHYQQSQLDPIGNTLPQNRWPFGHSELPFYQAILTLLSAERRPENSLGSPLTTRRYRPGGSPPFPGRAAWTSGLPPSPMVVMPQGRPTPTTSRTSPGRLLPPPRPNSHGPVTRPWKTLPVLLEDDHSMSSSVYP